MNDTRDWFIMLLVAGMWIAGTVYLFMYHSPLVYSTWCGLGATMTGVYHWITLKDSKVPDA